jgi:hypothetical protein
MNKVDKHNLTEHPEPSANGGERARGCGRGVVGMRRLLVIGTVLAATVLMVPGPAAPSGLGSAEVARQLPVLFNNDPWDDLAIGVPGENAGAGVVNVLDGSDVGLIATSLVRQQGNPEPGDRFGAALAKGYFDGDSFLDLAVGAPHESIGTVSAAGAVVVFYGSASGLTGAGQVLLQGNPENGDSFGSALDAAFYDAGDGWDLAVGAPGETVATLGAAGAVGMFYGGPGGLNAQEQLIFQTVAGVAGRFGAALAGGAFHNTDPFDLVVGVPGADVSGRSDAGAILVFQGTAGGVVGNNPAMITQFTGGVGGTAEPGDRFGSTLAEGHFQPGPMSVAVGVPGEDVGGAVDAGAVNTLRGSTFGLVGNATVLFQSAAGVGGTAESGDRFGSALSDGEVFFNNFDSGGDGDLAVGVPGEDVGGAVDAGAVNVLHGSAVGLVGASLFTQDTAGVGGAAESGDEFGAAVD